MGALFAFAAVLLAIGLGAALIHGRLAALRLRYLAALKRLETTLRRRYDFVMTLTETAWRHLAQDQQIGEALTELALAREAASLATQGAAQGDALTLRELARAEERLDILLARLRALVQPAPGQAPPANLGGLFLELDDAAHHVALARLAYNEAARDYNAYRDSFPALLLAGAFGYGEAPPLDFGGALFRAPSVPDCPTCRRR